MVRFATDHRYVFPCAFKEVGFDCLKTHEHIFHLLRCPGPNTAGRCQVVACQKETIVFQRPVFVVIFWLQLPPTNSLHPKLTKKTTEASVPNSQHSFVVQEQTNLHCRVKRLNWRSWLEQERHVSVFGHKKHPWCSSPSSVFSTWRIWAQFMSGDWSNPTICWCFLNESLYFELVMTTIHTKLPNIISPLFKEQPRLQSANNCQQTAPQQKPAWFENCAKVRHAIFL